MSSEYDDTLTNPLYAPIIGGAVEALAGPSGARTVTTQRALTIVRAAVHHARQAAGRDAAFDLYSADQVADQLGISERRVRALAAARGLGAKLGKNTWVFRRSDIAAMQDRPRGRPRQPAA